MPRVIAKLGELKDISEGRASRAQACLASGQQRKIAGQRLEATYEDARAVHNNLIDGYVATVTSQTDKSELADIDIGLLNNAERKVRYFVRNADTVLKKYGCPVAFKTSWVAIAGELAGPIVSGISDWWRGQNDKDKARKELINDLDKKKISAWNEVSVISVYDWRNGRVQSVHFASQIPEENRSICVNAWALAKTSDQFKQRDICKSSGAYLTYMGSKPEKLEGYLHAN